MPMISTPDDKGNYYVTTKEKTGNGTKFTSTEYNNANSLGTDWRGTETGKVVEKYYQTPTITTPSGGSSDSSSGSDFLSAYQSYVNEYKNMVASYQAQLDKLAEENYKLQVAQNEQSAQDSRNQANLNAKRTDRWLNQQYGGGLTGAGLSNQARNKTAWNNTIAGINTALMNNNSQASADRYNTKANNAQTALSRYSAIDDSYLNYLKQIA